MDEVGQGNVGTADAAHAAATFRIFINYRREDAPVTVELLWEKLKQGVAGQDGFTEEQIFKDIDTIEPGLDYRDVIRDAVESTDVFLAVIGPRWLTAVEKGTRKRRLEDPTDFVRLEIEAALARAKEHKDVRVMPTLVEGAKMPDAADLPEEVRELAHRQAVVLAPTHRVYDTERLVARLKLLEREKLKRIVAARQERERIAADEVAEGKPTAALPQAPPAPEPAGSRRRWVALGGGALGLAAAAVLSVLALADGGQPNGSTTAGGDEAWTPSSVSDVAVLRAAALLPGGAVIAVGEGDENANVVVSERGGLSEETVVDGTSATMYAVAASESAGVAAGRITASHGDYDAAIWRRTGDTWARVCADPVCGDLGSGERRQVIYALAITQAGLVAVGADDRDASDAAVWFSEDGQEWDRRAENDADLGGPGNQVMNGVAAVGDRLVAVGWTGRVGAVWVSDDDGQTWRRKELGSESLQLSAVSARGSRIVAVGKRHTGPTFAAAWLSTDRGSTWEEADVPDAARRGQQMADVQAVSSGWIAVGDDHPDGRHSATAAVWRSSDGSTWTPVSSDAFADEGEQSMTGATALDDGRVLVVGTGKAGGARTGRIWLSDAPT